jgi:hypothetical protein
MKTIATVLAFIGFTFAAGFWFFMGVHFAAKMMKVRLILAVEESALKQEDDR